MSVIEKVVSALDASINATIMSQIHNAIETRVSRFFFVIKLVREIM